MFQNMLAHSSTNVSLGEVMLYAAIAGLLGSVAGCIIVLFIKKPSKNLIGISFAFASAVLLALAFIDFIPHAIGEGGHYHGHGDSYEHGHEGAGIWLTLVGIGVGIGLIFILGLFDKHGHEHLHGVMPHNKNCSHPEEFAAMKERKQKKRLILMAVAISVAIILHDFPKGLAIGASGSIWVAIAIGLSCMPEGMAIAMPLKAGGVKWWKIIGICVIAGLSTVLGALVGYFLGGINATVSGILFAVAAGCIIGVVFKEMLPMSYQYAKSKKLHALAMVIGILLVIVLHYFLHDLMH